MEQEIVLEQEGKEYIEDLSKENFEIVSEVDIDVNKVDNIATVSIKRWDGSTKEVEILDGQEGKQGPAGPQGPIGLTGPKGDKGDKGDTGSQGPKGDKGDTGSQGPQGIQGPKGDIGETGPQGIQGPAGQDGYTPIKGIDYFTPEDIASLNIPTDTGDLTNEAGYVTNTDYANSTTGGVIKIYNSRGTTLSDGALQTRIINYSDYESLSNNAFIGKGTLENIIVGKDLATKTDISNAIGTALNQSY